MIPKNWTWQDWLVFGALFAVGVYLIASKKMTIEQLLYALSYLMVKKPSLSPEATPDLPGGDGGNHGP